MSDYQLQAQEEMVDAIARQEQPSTVRAGYRRLTAKFDGACDSCGAATPKGSTILYNRRHELRLLCLDCGARADAGEALEHNGPARLTRRERLEARAERRREWAEARSRSSDAAFEGARAIADGIPFGQPILVGHHSEGRHRRDVARIENGMRRAVDDARMADRHEHAAGELARQLDRSIYSDDVDAPERLAERVAELEAERDRWKAYNAACRKAGECTAGALELLDDKQRAHVETLARVCPYQLGKHGEVTYTNLTANIARNRKRLQQLERDNERRAAGGHEAAPAAPFLSTASTAPDSQSAGRHV